MISIVICSRQSEISNEFVVNISETIGSDYELVVIDNSSNQYSIFEAYNLGIKQSMGNLICFVHDDILFRTKEWGRAVEDIFNADDKIGLLGVAGSKIKTRAPSAWWDCPDRYKFINIIQHIKGQAEKWQIGFDKENSIENVVAIDGVFMVLRKNLQFKFKEELLGFHNYDINISLECVNKGYKVVASNHLLLEHNSIGTLNKDWYRSTTKVYNTYKEYLPISADDINVCTELEVRNYKKFIRKCLDSHESKYALFFWSELFKVRPFLVWHLYFPLLLLYGVSIDRAVKFLKNNNR